MKLRALLYFQLLFLICTAALAAAPFNAPGGIIAPNVRNMYTTTSTFYVTKGGNDSNNCTSSANSCLTIRGALGKLVAANDMGGNAITISIGPGTFDESILIGGPNAGGSTTAWANGAPIEFIGAGSGSTTIAPNVNCSPGYGDAFTVSGYASILIGSMTLASQCSGRADIFAQNYAYVGLANSDVVFGTTGVSGNGQHVHVEGAAYFEVSGTLGYKISGNAGQHWSIGSLGHVALDVGAVVTCTGPVTISQFIWVEQNAVGATGGTAWSGCTNTGSSYYVVTGGKLNLKGATALPPGNAGTSTLLSGGVVYNDSKSIYLLAPGGFNTVTSVFTGNNNGGATVSGTINQSAGTTWLDLVIFGAGSNGGNGIVCGSSSSCSAGAGGAGGGKTIVHVRWSAISGSPTACGVTIPSSHALGTPAAGSSTLVSCGGVQYRAGGAGDGANGASAAVAGGGGSGGLSSGGAGTTTGGAAGGGGVAGGLGLGGGSIPVAASRAGGAGAGSAATGGSTAGGYAIDGPAGGGSGGGFNAGASQTAGLGGSNQANNATAVGSPGVSDDSGGSGGGGGAPGTGAANGGAGGAGGCPGGGGGGGGDVNGTGAAGPGGLGCGGAVYATQY